jgi:aspartyl-tRNA(Asn)/glutamyl-tRNA(Gln) amidotransferase subunit A
MKPTFGTISMSGVLPLSPSLDHIGIISRKAIDSQIIYDVIKSPARLHSPKIIKLTNSNLISSNSTPTISRLLYPSNHFLEVLNCEIKNEFFNLLSLLKRNGKEVMEVNLDLTREYYKSWKTVRLYEAARVHFLKLQDNSGQLSAEVRDMLLKGSRIDHVTYLDAKSMIKKIRKKFLNIFGKDNEILLLPTTVIHAPRLRSIYFTINKKSQRVRDLLLRNTIVFNSIGFPALTIPFGKFYFSQSILPIGLQLVGAPHNDKLVLETGMSIERLVANSHRLDN